MRTPDEIREALAVLLASRPERRVPPRLELPAVCPAGRHPIASGGYVCGRCAAERLGSSVVRSEMTPEETLATIDAALQADPRWGKWRRI